MSEKLVIVESPSKALTIKKYLGKGYEVVASMGHVIDLPKSSISIDVENDFEPKFITIRGKGDLLKSLKKDAKNAKKIYLATDPDREGEAISYHLANALGISDKEKCRITFNEITKKAVTEAIKNPRQIDTNLVSSQMARRVLDRIVGYKISPILWKKVKKGLSAGRVQSVTLRLISDREEEIENFKETTYFSIDASFLKSKKTFTSKLYINNSPDILSEENCDKILDEIKNETFYVKDIKSSVKKKGTPPPFITSTLQQEAGRKLGFTTSKTMQIAQSLYEGINIKGKGHIGLITYMRTDSLRISDDAIIDVRNYIKENFETSLLPKSAKVYKTKKSAQDAHEAIRPSDVFITPSDIKDSVTPDQYKLYNLIHSRFVASQMEDAKIKTTTVFINAKDYELRTFSSNYEFKGFTSLYDDSDEKEEKNKKIIEELKKDEVLNLSSIEKNTHHTQPPLRFTESSLVKTLEELGVGRPSTYAPTITTIIQRGYIVRQKKQLVPTELGKIVNSLMKENFSSIVDVKFTASMEENLDKIEEGKVLYKNLIKDFYYPFIETVDKAEEKIGHIEIKDEVSDVVCDKCGALMVYKHGKFGKFLACPSFPNCRNTKAIVKKLDVKCPLCSSEVIEKKSKRGKIFYGCTSFPDCNFTSWDKPTNEKCEKCGEILYEKGNKKVCLNCQTLKKQKKEEKNEG